MNNNTVAIPSALSGTQIVLSDFDGTEFTVELLSSNVKAVRRVYDSVNPDGLASFLAELARHSKPWNSPIQWMPVERELRMSAACDPRGHVVLNIEFSHLGIPEEWQVQFKLQLELGQLPSLAKKVGEFFEQAS